MVMLASRQKLAHGISANPEWHLLVKEVYLMRITP